MPTLAILAVVGSLWLGVLLHLRAFAITMVEDRFHRRDESPLREIFRVHDFGENPDSPICAYFGLGRIH